MVHVVSCRFLRLSCSEDDHPLFRQEYARSNRERGIKLLRCFPHCCPEHARRSYCGCSVHVLVTFSTDVRTASSSELDELLVCVRFEPSRVTPLWPASLESFACSIGASAPSRSFQGGDQEDISREDERSLGVGERVTLPARVLGPTGRVSSSDSVWIRADRESGAKQRAFPQNSVLYVINNRRFPKWLYSYDSSVTRMQRDMTHHLVAYVLQLSGSEQRSQSQFPVQDGGEETQHQAVVLARHASPGFLLVSYRRSGGPSHRAPGSAVPAVDSPSDNGGLMSNVETSADREIASSLGNPHRLSNQFHHGEHENRQARVSDELRPEASSDMKSSRSADVDGFELTGISLNKTTGSDSSWQCGHHARRFRFQEKGQHLTILWRFLQRVRLVDIGFDMDLPSPHVRSLWLQAVAVLKAPDPRARGELESIVGAFLSEVFERTEKKASVGLERSIVRATALLFLRTLSASSVRRLLLDAFRDVGDGTSKEQLHERFVVLVSGLYKSLSDVLRDADLPDSDKELAARDRAASLPALVDDVLSLAYSQGRFGTLRGEASALLLGQPTPGSLARALDGAFRVYTAQTREVMIASATETCPSAGVQQQSNEASSSRDAWSRRWLLQPDSAQVLDITAGSVRDALGDMRLVDVAQIVSECGCVDAELGECLSLSSSLSLPGNGPTSPMVLVLDGRLRVFRALPSGLSSMIATTGGWCVGDYAAEFSEQEQTLGVDFFGFVESASRVFARDGVQSRGNQGNAEDESKVSVARGRRASLSITLERERHADDQEAFELCLVVHGTVFGSAYNPQTSEQAESGDLLTQSSTERGRLWGELDWSPLYELRVRYTAI